MLEETQNKPIQHADHIHDEHCDHEHHEHSHDHAHAHTHEAGIDWGRVQGWIKVGILFLSGVYFIDLALPGGNLTYYVNVESLGWLTWVGAAIFLALAAISTLDLLRGGGEDDHHHHDHDDSHDHDHQHSRAGSIGSWLVLGVVAMPLIFGLGVPSKPLGAEAITGDVSSDLSSMSFGNTAPTVNIPAQDRNVLDWVRAFTHSRNIREFEGQEATLIGFVYRDATFNGTDDFMVVRFVMSCCVADARPIGLIVDNISGENFTDDSWVQINGRFEIRAVNGVDTPVIVTESITPVSEPKQPYLYF